MSKDELIEELKQENENIRNELTRKKINLSLWQDTAMDIKKQLEQYKDTRLTPEDVERASKLLDAEEQGLLKQLPCKIGDTIYTIGVNNAPCDKCTHGEEVHNDVMECLRYHLEYECPSPERFVEEKVCNGFEIGAGGIELVDEWGYDMKHISKPYYFTREEAEEALKGGVSK